MTNEEKAKLYAQKVLEEQRAKLERAYLNQIEEDKTVIGLIDSIISLMKTSPLIAENFFHEFELPSGNKWLFFPTIKVSSKDLKKYPLPSKSDFNEFFQNCKITFGEVYEGIKTNDLYPHSHFVDLTVTSKSGNNTTFAKIPCFANPSISFWTLENRNSKDGSAVGYSNTGKTHVLHTNEITYLPLALVWKTK